MGRVGGRNVWIAVPAGLGCLAVVAALVYLALPMVPVTLAWTGDTLRRAMTPQQVAPAGPTPAEQAVADGSIDCRLLYPDDLWNELRWHEGVLLDQTSAAPATEVTALTDALTPAVLVTCDWRVESGGGIVTTLSEVDAGASPIAGASLTGQGFACDTDDDAVVCTRSRGDVTEEHTLRSGLWLVSVATGWQPDDFAARLDRHVFG